MLLKGMYTVGLSVIGHEKFTGTSTPAFRVRLVTAAA
jgi:hypothetical protein